MRLLKSKSAKNEIVRLNIVPPIGPGPQNGIAIAAIVKDEARGIEEWLRFHLAAGVDHFLLYDDGSVDETVSVAKACVGPDQITVFPWSQRLKEANGPKTLHNQALAYAHAVSNFGTQFRWMGFFDIDEFLFPITADNLPNALAGVEHAENILLPWHMFGRQGFEETPARILPNYRQRMRNPYQSRVKGLLNFKCIVNPAHVTKVYVHGFEVRDQNTIWNSAGDQFTYDARLDPRFAQGARLQLNHYFSTSDAQLEEKIGKGSIGLSAFTRDFKTVDERRKLLVDRVLEIERDTVEDTGIIEFCNRVGFDPGATDQVIAAAGRSA